MKLVLECEHWRSCWWCSYWCTGIVGLKIYEGKYRENADVTVSKPPIKIISYQILLKHQVFIIRIVIPFKIALLYILFRPKEDCLCRRDESNHLLFYFMKSRDKLMTSVDETVIC